MLLTLRLCRCLLWLSSIWLISLTALAQEPKRLYIGLNADLSSAAKEAGKAIEQGALLAIQEINQSKLLPYTLHLISRDHRGNPMRGRDNMLDFSQQDNLVAVLGGVHTPVAIAELDVVHKHKLIYLIPWAAGRQVVEHHYHPNYVFRLSVNDKFAAQFLLESANTLGFKKPSLLLENTAWGRSNANAAQAYANKAGTALGSINYFNWSKEDFKDQLLTIKQAGHDHVILVANAREAEFILHSMLALDKSQRLPIISHWGISSGDLLQQDWLINSDIVLYFLQTICFKSALAELAELTPQQIKTSSNRKLGFIQRYCEQDIQCLQTLSQSHVMGSAHAYDLVHLLARAIKTSKSIDRSKIRHALEQELNYDAIMPLISPAFTPERHDALEPSSYKLTHFLTTQAEQSR